MRLKFSYLKNYLKNSQVNFFVYSKFEDVVAVPTSSTTTGTSSSTTTGTSSSTTTGTSSSTTTGTSSSTTTGTSSSTTTGTSSSTTTGTSSSTTTGYNKSKCKNKFPIGVLRSVLILCIFFIIIYALNEMNLNE